MVLRDFERDRGELREIFMIGIDEGHGARYGTSLETVLDAREANRDGFYRVFQ